MTAVETVAGWALVVLAVVIWSVNVYGLATL